MFVEELKKIIKGDIDTTEESLFRYSHDASIFEVKPACIVYPKDESDIKNIVKWVKENKQRFPELSITVRAAGTCMSGGPLGESIILDTTRYMNQILEIKKVEPYQKKIKIGKKEKEVQISGIGRAMPGCFYRDFEKETLEKNLLLPSYTASKSINALGGMIGNNSGGELSLRFGKTDNYVRSLRIVLSDGEIYQIGKINRNDYYNEIAKPGKLGELYKTLFELWRDNKNLIDRNTPIVSKNSSGYKIWDLVKEEGDFFEFNFTNLIIGAQGTLGIVTEIEFELIKPQPYSKSCVIFLKDLDNLANIIDKTDDTNPLTIESYDDTTFNLAIKFFFDFIKQKGILGTIFFGLSFIPEFIMAIRGGVPKLILLVEYDGENEKTVNAMCVDLKKRLSPFKLNFRITRNKREADKYWSMRRDSFALLRKHSGDRRTAPFIDDFVIPVESMPLFLPKINEILKKYDKLLYTIAGHAGNGNFHIIPLMNFNDPETKKIIMSLSAQVYALVREYQGSITGEHGDGIIRTPFMSYMFEDEMLKIFQTIKTTCDPQNIFNPNKKVGTTFEYLESHIIEPKIGTSHSS